MDREQEAMAKSLGDGHRIIRGVAGSGKALVLVYRARLLAQVYPSHKILVTCFNRSLVLAGQLKALLNEHKNIDVVNLDKLMWDVTRAARLKAPRFDQDGGNDRVAEVALQALQRGAGPRYKAVLLDEAQTWVPNALKFALGLVQEGVEDFIIVADWPRTFFAGNSVGAKQVYRRKGELESLEQIIGIPRKS